MSRQRFFNLVVTNVPGPQFLSTCWGAACWTPSPWCRWPPARASEWRCSPYNGRINFGLVGDFDLLWDLDDLALDIEDALAELAEEAGVELRAGERAGV